MNPQETEQVIARDELWVPTAERVNISTTNVRLETTVKQKEETFQVVIDVIKNSTCIKAFTISADVPEILMQQFWYTITKIKGSESYEFLLADKRCVIDAEVFRKILDICPRKEGEDFTEVQNDEDTLTFLVDLGYSGPLHKYTNMFVDHMHQPWRTLAACINKCLSGKTASNDKLRKSRIDILWGMFYRENVDYPSLIWEDIAYQIDHRREKKSRRENMPYPRFTKDDGVVSRLKFVRMGKDVQQYGLAIPATMLNKEIMQSESYKRFILYSTGQIPPKKSRGKGSQGKKSADPTEESVDVSDESEPEPLIRRKTSRKSISLTEAEEESCTRQVHATHARIVLRISPPNCEEEARSDYCYSETTRKPRMKENVWDYVRKNADTEMKDAEKTTDITKETILSHFDILRVAKLEQDMSKVKKFNHSADVLASIQSQVPPVVDKYLGTKLDDALLKTLERHTSPEEIIRIKRDQEEKKQEPTYTIKLTDQAALEEFDLKSALFKFMHKNKSTNRNPANYRLYHALMEALIEDENAMDKEVADTVKDHKRKHDGDDDDDDDDEGPSAGSNQGKSIKKRRKREPESAQKPSTTKESSKGKDPKVGSKTGKSAPAKDPVEEPTEKVIMDEGHVSDPDTTTWQTLLGQCTFAKAHQDPDENKLHNKIDDIGSFIRWYCRRIGKEELSKADLEGPAFMMVKGFHENSISLQFQMEECHKLLTNQIDLVNPEGHRIVPDISNPLPLGGPPGQVTIQPQFFFNKDLEYLLTGDKERNRALSISKLKAALYQDFGLEELVPSLWIESEREYDISAAYGITHWWFSRKQFYINKHSEPSDRDAVRSHMRILSVISKLDHLPKQDKVHLHNAVSLWTRNIVIRKRVEDLQLGIESYQTKLNLEQPNWDASDFPFKEDYTIVFKPRAVIYKDNDNNRKMMIINEVHKFSDGTLTIIKEKLDFMVKDFKLFKFNKGMENRKWTEDDKRRSEDFIEVIERRLKIRRIF
ncbi:hypothetical protein Tco_1033146 [Tanacetum coccineum]|uniref:Uncharacterized protein n=1 Tax=Tanacetum coccineum TaxID=301880 RepID=A0ABQ5GF72_9ASTR